MGESLEERLRAQTALPLCPYDRRSPDYWTTNDTDPCKVCGQLNDTSAPILCRGADTRLFTEAAAALSAKDAELVEARAFMRKYAEAGHNDTMRDVEIVAKAEARATAAEAENARLKRAFLPLDNLPPPDTFSRERLGELVRHVWIKWAKRQPAPKPTWLVLYAELSEPDKEADRMIGENIAQDIYGRCLQSFGRDLVAAEAKLLAQEVVIGRVRGRLLSIARNTCCDTCQEAAIIAREALALLDGEGLECSRDLSPAAGSGDALVGASVGGVKP